MAKKFIFHSALLTFFKKRVVSFLLKLNIPTVPIKGVLPVAKKKGIITLTLVISRVSGKPVVTRGLFVMLEMFKVKTKIQLQVEEYLQWKSTFSIYTAKGHREVLTEFVKKYNYKTLSDVVLDDIRDYHQSASSRFGAVKSMEAIRGFLSYFYRQKQHKIDPKQVTNQGVAELREVEESDSIITMRRPKRGRPLKIELIKQVKRLRDNEKLEFRQIGRALGKDVSQVYVWYKFKLPDEKVDEKLSTVIPIDPRVEEII
jgi:hypothetical protein